MYVWNVEILGMAGCRWHVVGTTLSQKHPLQHTCVHDGKSIGPTTWQMTPTWDFIKWHLIATKKCAIKSDIKSRLSSYFITELKTTVKIYTLGILLYHLWLIYGGVDVVVREVQWNTKEHNNIVKLLMKRRMSAKAPAWLHLCILYLGLWEALM